jgi:hypothetical protein
MSIDLGQTRWLLFEQSGHSIPMPFLVLLIFWLTIILLNFDLFAPPNATVIASLFLCPLPVSGAIFMILELYVPARFSVRGRDLEGAVADAKARVASEVQMPEGMHLEWVGEYGELRAANRRLAVVVPVALLLIMGVLYAATL